MNFSRLKKALYISIASPFAFVGGAFLTTVSRDLGNLVMMAALAAGLVSLIMSGFKPVLLYAKDIAILAAVSVPMPLNLIAIPMAFEASILTFMILPVIPVAKNYRQARLLIKAYEIVNE